MVKKIDRSLLVLLISCILGSIIVYQMIFVPDGQGANSASQIVQPSYIPPEIQPMAALKSERSYSAIDKMPIFFETREPPKPPVKAKPKPKQIRKPDLAVIGIVSDTDKKTVLLKADKNGSVAAYSSGDVIAGWTIISIEDTHIILESGGASERFTIKDYPELKLEKPKMFLHGQLEKNRLIEIK